jgi:uncharacterized protein (TIGR03435 family)
MVYQLRRSGLFSAENVPARFLLRLAYGVQDVQITGGPSWINSKRYNIQAKAEGISNPDQMLPMLQTLLADRFKLVIHSETKELQVYNLVEEKRSSKLEAAKPGGCFVRVPNMPRPAPPAGQSDALACGKIYFPGPNEMLGRGVRMPSFADGLSSRVGRTVIDKTADSGTYDVDFRWTPDQNSAAVQSADSAVPPDPDDVVPSISKALREQLGLKLDSAKGPVRVLVVDSIEEPSGN